MERLTALWLTANVLQFVDLAGKFFSTIYDTHYAGVLTDNVDLRSVANELDRLNASLRASIKEADAQSTPSNDDQALKKLACECILLTNDLAFRLDKVRVDAQHKPEWRTLWQGDAFNDIFKRLGNVCTQLASRLTLTTHYDLKTLSVAQYATFDRLDDETTAIVKELAQSPAEIASRIDAQTTELRMRMMEYQRGVASKMSQADHRNDGHHFPQVIADGHSRLHLGDVHYHNTYIGHRHDKRDTSAPEVQEDSFTATNRLKSPFSAGPWSRELSSSGPPKEEMEPKDVTTTILNMLKFRQMAARQEDIADAHTGTFHWLLEGYQRNSQRAIFSPLLPWLETGHGCYWVSGKAGSGKSTCMKYLGANPTTTGAVTRWAGSRQLVEASFYFWRGGTPLQRTHEGLLRSLLYSILSQRKELVQICFPAKFHELRFGIDSKSEVSSLMEHIKPAFQVLAGLDIGIRIFLIIDGLDEFDGDHAEISCFFMHLTSNPNFKVLLSSRPITACVEAFKECPSVHLQDLTRNDIRKYVEDTIGRHERMHQLMLEDPKGASNLQKLITSKASGVFLWVRLVVRSLLDGFRNYDRISDLKCRVNEYPPELGSLYLHMFQSMDIRYQSHAAQLLRIVVQSTVVQEKSPLTVLQMSFADEISPMCALKAPIRRLTLQERQAKCDSMEGRLRSRCLGLLEVIHKDLAPEALKSQEDLRVVDETTSTAPGDRYHHDSEVQVSHKSVLDFLAEEQVWSKLLSTTPKYDPNIALMAASLMQVKTLPSAVEVEHNIRHCLGYCRLLERSTNRSQTSFITELNRVVCMRGGDRASWDEAANLPYLVNSSAGPLLSSRMLLLASEAGLSRYLDALLDQSLSSSVVHFDVSFLIPRLVSIMVDALKKRYHTFDLADEYATLTKTFLDYLRIMPSAQAELISRAWIGTFCCISKIKDITLDWVGDQRQFETLQALLSIIRNFLENGADVHLSTYALLTSLSNDNTPTASEILLSWLHQLSDSLTLVSEENVMLEQQIDSLRSDINIRVAHHPFKIKQQAWDTWLSSRARQIDTEYSGRQQGNEMKRLSRLIGGGPFELHDVPVGHSVLKPCIEQDSATGAAHSSRIQALKGGRLKTTQPDSSDSDILAAKSLVDFSKHGKGKRKKDWFKLLRPHQSPLDPNTSS